MSRKGLDWSQFLEQDETLLWASRFSHLRMILFWLVVEIGLGLITLDMLDMISSREGADQRLKLTIASLLLLVLFVLIAVAGLISFFTVLVRGLRQDFGLSDKRFVWVLTTRWSAPKVTAIPLDNMIVKNQHSLLLLDENSRTRIPLIFLVPGRKMALKILADKGVALP